MTKETELKDNKEFPQTEKQKKIYEFWKVRGYSIVKAVLGNLNVSFHKERLRDEELGLNYQYLEQFYDNSREQTISKVLEICRNRIRFLKNNPFEKDRFNEEIREIEYLMEEIENLKEEKR